MRTAGNSLPDKIMGIPKSVLIAIKNAQFKSSSLISNPQIICIWLLTKYLDTMPLHGQLMAPELEQCRQ